MDATSSPTDFQTPVVLDPATLHSMPPKARINHELVMLRLGLSGKLADTMGLNDGKWTPEQLSENDRVLRERVEFIKDHELFSEIRVEGRPEGWMERFWGKLMQMRWGWVGVVRKGKGDREDVANIMRALDGARVV